MLHTIFQFVGTYNNKGAQKKQCKAYNSKNSCIFAL